MSALNNILGLFCSHTICHNSFTFCNRQTEHTEPHDGAVSHNKKLFVEVETTLIGNHLTHIIKNDVALILRVIKVL